MANFIASEKCKGADSQRNNVPNKEFCEIDRGFWFGTFKPHNVEDIKFDIVSVKVTEVENSLRGPPVPDPLLQQIFQSNYSEVELLDMINDRTYLSHLKDFMSMQYDYEATDPNIREVTFHPLFEKKLTPSDVGKLSRIAIPKRKAVACFPPMDELNPREVGNGGIRSSRSIPLSLQDSHSREWNLSYSHWRSSDSFVITEGWKKFVDEQGIKAEDVLAFYGSRDGNMIIMKHVKHEDYEKIGNGLIVRIRVRGLYARDAGTSAGVGQVSRKKIKVFGVVIN